MRYKVTIEELSPYAVKSSRVEAADGKRYSSTYLVPEGVEYKQVAFETGATDYNKRDVFMQEVEDMDLTKVIQAINQI